VNVHIGHAVRIVYLLCSSASMLQKFEALICNLIQSRIRCLSVSKRFVSLYIERDGLVSDYGTPVCSNIVIETGE